MIGRRGRVREEPEHVVVARVTGPQGEARRGDHADQARDGLGGLALRRDAHDREDDGEADGCRERRHQRGLGVLTDDAREHAVGREEHQAGQQGLEDAAHSPDRTEHVAGGQLLLAGEGTEAALLCCGRELAREVVRVGTLRRGILALVLAGLTAGVGFGHGYDVGAPDEMFSMVGSWFPFAKTKAEREQKHDPRPSIEERYANRAQYLELVGAAARRLAETGYLLDRDVPKVIDYSAAEWDYLH